jgi:hypothetical protein
MTDNQPQRIYRQFTPEERARWEQARDEALAMRPQLIEKGRRLREASQEPTFSGALRTAIHQSPKPLPVIASEAGMDVLQLDEFLMGERTLRSDAIDRLIQVLGMRFPREPLAGHPKMVLPEPTTPPIINPALLNPPQSPAPNPS